MSRASWGGQQDLSGMFSSLINEQFNAARAGVNDAVNKAESEQAAKDQEMQARWTAGKISDEKWLDYIRSRVADSTDPEERSQWQQILLQNQDAISDAQWETKFQQNKITVGQLMAHYRKRMGAVEANSPAYRELASRNSELLEFKRSGGVYYKDQFGSSSRSSGGGGGRSSRSSGGGYGGDSGGGGAGGATALGDLQAIVDEGLRGGPTDVGYLGGEIFDTSGPNVIDVNFSQPKTSSMSSLFVVVNDGLLASQKTLNAFFKYIEANPKATAYTIPGTGQVMPINFKTVRAADEQWMRVTQTLANVAAAEGDGSEVAYQEGLLGTFVTTTMRDHNVMFNQSSEDDIGMWTKRVFARMNAAGTPEERKRIAAEAAKQLDTFVEGKFPEYVTQAITSRIPKDVDDTRGGTEEYDIPTTLEEQLAPEIYDSHRLLAMMFDVVINPDQYTDEDIDAIFDESLDAWDIGQGAAKIKLSDLLGGGGENSTIGIDSLGAGDFRVQAIGLGAAELISRGIATPDDLPPGTDLYAYQWNSATNRMEPTLAVATPSADGSFDVVPLDTSGNPATNATKYISRLNGRPVDVWTPVIDAAPASGYVYRFSDDMVLDAGEQGKVQFKQGQLVPSSVLESLGVFNLNAYVQNGRFYKEAPPGIRQADVGGKTWYFDLRTNTWSAVTPWDIETDKTDPNAIFVLDPDYLMSTTGLKTVDQSKLKGAMEYVTLPLREGYEGYIVPFDKSMHPHSMQKWLDGEIAAGNIIPDEYKYIDGEGNAQVMTEDQMRVLYWDEALEAKATSMQNQRLWKTDARYAGREDAPRAYREFADADLWQEAKQSMFMQAHDNEKRRAATAPLTGPAQVGDTNVARMAFLERQANSLGIRTGYMPPQVAAPRPSGPGMDDRLLRTAALLAAQNRARVERQPRLMPLAADPTPPPLKPLAPPPPPKTPAVKPIVKPSQKTPPKEADAPYRAPVTPPVLTGVDRSINETVTRRYQDANRGMR